MFNYIDSILHAWEKMENSDILQGLGLVVISSVVAWFVYLVYQIKYHPRNAYKLLPKRIRTWSFLTSLGVTDRSTTFRELDDRFTSLQDITKAMRANGLDRANLIIGIDFTASNEWQGRKSFGGRSLHHIAIEPKTGKVSKWNPYQKVIRTIGETMRDFDDGQQIPVYGFGDERTKDTDVFPLLDDSPCQNIEEVLVRYTRSVKSVALSGPTSFAPIIEKAIDVVRTTGKYHVLLILADGRVDDEQDKKTREAIVRASNYPLSIVVVGVGDGPWDVMRLYDNELPQRRFDNFQFVEFVDHKKGRFSRDDSFETEFAVQAMMEIPDQYKAIKALGLLKDDVINDNDGDYNRNNRNVMEKRYSDTSISYHRHNASQKAARQTDV